MTLAMCALLLTQSCKKCDLMERPPVITAQTVNASVKDGATYTYTLPVAGKNSFSRIIVAPTHATAASITTDATGSYVLQYVAAPNYSGGDVVVVTTTEVGLSNNSGNCNHGNQGNCNHGSNGGCHHGQDDPQTINTTFNLTVTGNSISSAASAAKQSNQ